MSQFERMVIFDLDGTVIDSSHRQVYDKHGVLDLDHWKANNTPEKIWQDKLLPLADYWKSLHGSSAMIVISTARVMGDTDYAFLDNHGLKAHKVFSRNIDDHRHNGDMKRAQLNPFINLAQFRYLPKTMYDDDQEVIDSLKGLGIELVNPSDIL